MSFVVKHCPWNRERIVTLHYIILFTFISLTSFDNVLAQEQVDSGQSSLKDKFLLDAFIDKLQFLKPTRGVGKAGTFIFKSVNFNNNGIVLDLTNINNMFDSQIFIRPTFLGFTTPVGSYGFELAPGSFLGNVEQADLVNSKVIVDESQFNLAGEHLSYFTLASKIKLKKFRIYCQKELNASRRAKASSIEDCLNFLTVNGNYEFNSANEAATLEYEGTNNITGERNLIETEIKNFDLRKNELMLSLKKIKSNTAGNYYVTAQNIELNCSKLSSIANLGFTHDIYHERDLNKLNRFNSEGELDIEKLKKGCLNHFVLHPIKLNIEDLKEASRFNLDLGQVSAEDGRFRLDLAQGVFADKASATAVQSANVDCIKSLDTDLFELVHVIRDCISGSQIIIKKLSNTAPDEKKSSIKDILISTQNGHLYTRAQVKVLGVSAKVALTGNISINEVKREVFIEVKEADLPLGINSVGLLMYFLKKNLISKDITIRKNMIKVKL